jgi:hypothetical protein
VDGYFSALLEPPQLIFKIGLSLLEFSDLLPVVGLNGLLDRGARGIEFPSSAASAEGLEVSVNSSPIGWLDRPKQAFIERLACLGIEWLFQG